MVSLLFPGCLLFFLLSCFTCHGILLFGFGVFSLVFWTLTCLQCPVPCHHYRGERWWFPPGHHSYPSYRNVWLWLWVLRQSWLDLDLAGFIRYLFGESVILDNSYPTTNTEYVWAVRWWEVMFPDGLLCLLLERKNNTWLLLPEKQWECQEFWSRGRQVEAVQTLFRNCNWRTPPHHLASKTLNSVLDSYPLVDIMLEKETAKSRLLRNIYHWKEGNVEISH